MVVIPLPLGIKRIRVDSPESVELRARIEVAGDPIEILAICNELPRSIECRPLTRIGDLEDLEDLPEDPVGTEISVGKTKMFIASVVGIDARDATPKVAIYIGRAKAILYVPKLKINELPARKVSPIPLPYAAKLPKVSNTTTIVVDSGNRKMIVYSGIDRGFYIVAERGKVIEKGIAEAYPIQQDTQLYVFTPLEIAEIDGRHALELI